MEFNGNIWGATVELTHAETQAVVARAREGAGAATGVLGGLGVPGWAAAVLGLFFQAQLALVEVVDHGNGVKLTLPWVAIALGQFWAIVPTAR
jgi:hypothetical protein